MVEMKYGIQGSPWEFNLRDVLRWCHLITHFQIHRNVPPKPEKFLDLIYLQRFRSTKDRQHVLELFHQVFGYDFSVDLKPYYNISPSHIQIGSSFLPRGSSLCSPSSETVNLLLLPSFLNPLENLMQVSVAR